MKKPKKMKTNTFEIKVPKPRNQELHDARNALKAGRQSTKNDFNRAREKQKSLNEF